MTRIILLAIIAGPLHGAAGAPAHMLTLAPNDDAVMDSLPSKTKGANFTALASNVSSREQSPLGKVTSTITVNEGDYPHWVSWQLTCDDGTDIAGGAPYNRSASVTLGSRCTLNMDGTGELNGWNGAKWKGFGETFFLFKVFGHHYSETFWKPFENPLCYTTTCMGKSDWETFRLSRRDATCTGCPCSKCIAEKAKHYTNLFLHCKGSNNNAYSYYGNTEKCYHTYEYYGYAYNAGK